MKNDSQTTRPAWRTIPLFISSTFRDMHAERDELADVVFPALSERLKPRRCRLEPIDLRIGVETDSAKTERDRELQILNVCLAEINRSRPFMLVLIGDRYGWMPGRDRITAASNDAGFEILDSDASVTALEIEYGLLKKNTNQRHRSLVCLRDPLPYSKMPHDKAAVYSDAYSYDEGASNRVKRLQKLKTKICADDELAEHIWPYSLDWDQSLNKPKTSSVKQWGQFVEARLWALLDDETKTFERQEAPTWEEEESYAIEEFVDRLNGNFIGRKKIVQQAIDLATSPAMEQATWGLCFFGATGSGKSALFAKLYHEFQRLSLQSHVLVLSHAAGISPRSGQIEWMLRRWIAELAAANGEPFQIPNDITSEALERLFVQWLHRAAKTCRVVLLVDALDQFVRTERARTVSWIPLIWPDNARLIVTATPGEESDYLKQNLGVNVVNVPPLETSESRKVTTHIYERFHRKPNDLVLSELLSLRRPDGTLASDNPLWLTLASDLLNQFNVDDFSEAEMSCGGTAEEKLFRLVLDRARNLPSNIEGLYHCLLARVEKVVGRAETCAFGMLIALSRNGWREQDFVHLLPKTAEWLDSCEKNKISVLDCQFAWNPLNFATLRRCFRSHVVNRGAYAQWDFAHATARSAILSYFQLSQDDRKSLHGLILDYIETLPDDDPLGYREKTFHIVGHRCINRAGKYFAQVAQDGLLLRKSYTDDWSLEFHG